MALVVLLVLVIAWVIVLAPPLLRSRSEIRRSDSIGDFHQRLGVLGRTQGSVAYAPSSSGHVLTPPAAARMGTAAMSMTAAQRSATRRREVFTALAAAVALTFLAAVTVGGGMWALNLLADILLGVYAALVAWFRQLSIERQQKVRYLPASRAPAPAPFVALRRTASS